MKFQIELPTNLNLDENALVSLIKESYHNTILLENEIADIKKEIVVDTAQEIAAVMAGTELDTQVQVTAPVKKRKADTSERQERKLIELINTAVQNSPSKAIKLIAGATAIEGIVSAEKMQRQKGMKSEPYTDIVLTNSAGEKINISAKAESAPSIAGGGGKAMKQMIPHLIKTFLEKTRDTLTDMGAMPGDIQIPDTYAKIPDDSYIMLLRGTPEMGGPVDYLYIGPMDVQGSSRSPEELFLNGRLITIADFANSNSLFFRCRRRREDQQFTLQNDKDGYPYIYGKSLSKKDIGRRLVVTQQNSVPRDAKIITI